MRLKLISIVLLAGLMGYGGYWFFISLNTDVYLEKASETLAERGVEFTYASYEVSGFPYRLVLTFEDPAISYRNGPLRVLVEGSRMEAIAQPWNLSHVIFFPEETNIQVAYGNKQIILKPGHLGFSLNGLGDGGYRLSSEMTGVEINSNLETGLPARLDSLAFHLRKESLEIPDVEELLEPRLLEIALSGVKDEDLSFQVTTSFRGQEVPKMTRAALAAWRNRGGTFEIDNLTLTQGAVSIEGAGSFTLDDSFRPLGVLTVAGATPNQMLMFFTASHWIEESDAALVRDFTRKLPNDPNGDDIILPLAFSIQDGFLTLGPARLLEIGPVIPE